MNNLEPIFTRQLLLLSLQRAMLGEIFFSLRGISVIWNARKVRIRAFVDGLPSAEDSECLSAIETEVLADLPETASINTEVIQCKVPALLPSLEGEGWVYRRRETHT